MSITRINEFQAKEGQGDKVRELLNSYAPVLRSSDGFHSRQVLQNISNPTRIVVIEVWDTIHAHQTAAKKITVNAFERTMMLLASPPKGEYYRA